MQHQQPHSKQPSCNLPNSSACLLLLCVPPITPLPSRSPSNNLPSLPSSLQLLNLLLLYQSVYCSKHLPIAKSRVQKSKVTYMPLFPDGNESSFHFWGLKIIIFMWFECFILTPTPHTIKTTSFLVVISPLATLCKLYCIKV